MTITKTLIAAVVAGLTSGAAFADPYYEPSAPFAISLGVTFGGEGVLALDTLSASVATGGGVAMSNATAGIIGGDSASSSNGGASSNSDAGLQSRVMIAGEGFTSTVGTGKSVHLVH
ncbi:hypothetical protein [Histidinibacterium lentulum]|uniref:Uncharacterized protein n=1 Tax=Histidinibacterium lentulum TaxID=2480588 RepID=A0A3N2R913_9RHOB|nr:hypothetical protein [Histidinibacterium lentulum]ROU03903.1 hypothetical protein EAT49_00380 [Histidinibacterium lentulum]